MFNFSKSSAQSSTSSPALNSNAQFHPISQIPMWFPIILPLWFRTWFPISPILGARRSYNFSPLGSFFGCSCPICSRAFTIWQVLGGQIQMTQMFRQQQEYMNSYINPIFFSQVPFRWTPPDHFAREEEDMEDETGYEAWDEDMRSDEEDDLEAPLWFGTEEAVGGRGSR